MAAVISLLVDHNKWPVLFGENWKADQDKHEYLKKELHSITIQEGIGFKMSNCRGNQLGRLSNTLPESSVRRSWGIDASPVSSLATSITGLYALSVFGSISISCLSPSASSTNVVLSPVALIDFRSFVKNS